MSPKREKATQKKAKLDFGDMKNLEEQILEHVRTNGGTAAVGGKDFVNEIVRTTFQALLNAEMEEHLGRSKYERNEESSASNHRNGKGSKLVKGDFGQAEIETPRDRDGSFQPQIIKKRESTIGKDWTEKIISLYGRGLTTQEISEHLQEMYGVEASPAFISRATESVLEEVRQWQNRRLEPMYAVLYLDGIRYKVRDGGSVKNKVIYLCLGVNLDGEQDVLGMWVAETEGAKFWLNVCQDLHARGVEDILIACVDGLAGFPEAITAVFPEADVQLCIVHHVRAVTRFVSYKDRKEFCADMRAIYAADTEQEALAALEHLEQKWGEKYPASIKSWRKNWPSLTTFFRYPRQLRRIIYTTNSIESLNSQLRKNTSNRKVFPSDDAVFKILYLNLKRITKKWKRRKEWSIVSNQLSIMFEERLTPFL
jgi:transposase-like protein